PLTPRSPRSRSVAWTVSRRPGWSCVVTEGGDERRVVARQERAHVEEQSVLVDAREDGRFALAQALREAFGRDAAERDRDAERLEEDVRRAPAAGLRTFGDDLGGEAADRADLLGESLRVRP